MSIYFFSMPDATGPRAPKRLLAGCHVSGTFGELIANSDPAKRRCVHKRLFGNILNAVGHGKYHIQFDDGSLLECFSNRLHMESYSASIPPDALPVQPNVVNANALPRAQEDIDAAEEQLIEAIKDSHEEEEHIVPPEHDDDDSTSEEHVAPEGEGEAAQPAAEVDPDGRMPGQLPTAATQVEEVRTYAQRKERAKEKVQQLLGQEVTIRQRNQMVTWKVIQESVAELEEEDLKLGLKDLSVLNLPKGKAIGKIFLQLFSPRWQDNLDKMNAAIEKQNSTEKGNKVRPLSEAEFLFGLGLIVGAVEYGNKGSSLWLNGKKKNDDDEWCTILPHPNFDCFMLEYRFKQF
jgi:hypothetical protein